MKRAVKVAGLVLLVGVASRVGRGQDVPDTLSVTFANDLGVAVTMENCGEGCHQAVVDRFGLAAGTSLGVNYSPGTPNTWRVVSATEVRGCVTVLYTRVVPHRRVPLSSLTRC